MSLLRLTPVRCDLSGSFISWWHREKIYSRWTLALSRYQSTSLNSLSMNPRESSVHTHTPAIFLHLSKSAQDCHRHPFTAFMGSVYTLWSPSLLTLQNCTRIGRVTLCKDDSCTNTDHCSVSQLIICLSILLITSPSYRFTAFSLREKLLSQLNSFNLEDRKHVGCP